jgi:hypothetical protein
MQPAALSSPLDVTADRVHTGRRQAWPTRRRMTHQSSIHPGWEEGWAIVNGAPHRWKVVGIYDTRQEAEAACTEKGDGFTVRWGAYNREEDDFVTGDPD